MKFASDSQRKAVFARLGKNQFVATTYIPAGAPYPFDGAYEQQQAYLDEYERERKEREKDSLLENVGEAAIGGLLGTGAGFLMSPSYSGGAVGSALRTAGGALGGGLIGGGLGSLLPGGLLTTIPAAGAGAGAGALSQFYSMYPRALYGGLIGATMTPIVFSRLRTNDEYLDKDVEYPEIEYPEPEMVGDEFVENTRLSDAFSKTHDLSEKYFNRDKEIDIDDDSGGTSFARNQMSVLYGGDQYFDEGEAAEWQRRYREYQLREAIRKEQEAQQPYLGPYEQSLLRGATEVAMLQYGGPIAKKIVAGAPAVLSRIPGVTTVSSMLGRSV
jgi:hypothetical protein